MTENKKAYVRRLSRWLERTGLKAKAVQLQPAEREFLESIFVPLHYARAAGLKRQSRAVALRHYLRRGLALNWSPTPLFDNSRFEALAGGTSTREVPDVLRWYREFRLNGLTPTVHFDPHYYLERYPDVLNAGVGAYEHYLRFGASEERQPNALFDPRWYEAVADRHTGEQDLPGHLHYLIYGLERGTPPNAALLAPFHRTPTARLDPVGFLERAEAAIAPWRERLDGDQLRMLLLLFHPDVYTGDGELADDSSGLARLEHFFGTGIEKGLDPGPLFSSKFYTIAAGMPDGDDGSPLLHFLETGKERRIVPTPLFDEMAYAKAWPDIARDKIWGFAHFVEHGVFEGRRLDLTKPRQGASLPPHSAAGRFHNWELFWKEVGFGRFEPPEGQPDAPTPRSVALNEIPERDLQIVRALFVPQYYAVEAGLDPARSEEEVLDHYLRVGLHSDLAPGPFFDPAIARTLTRTQGQPALLAWLKERRPSWPAPTALVDLEFYGTHYPDLKVGVPNLFEHYLLHGLSENRAPSWAFDPQWYMEAHDHPPAERQMPAYLHYILYGARRGLAPSRLLLTTFDGTDNAKVGLDAYKAVCSAGAAWSRKLGPDKLQVMLAMFSPYTYDGGGSLPEGASGPKRLAHFLETGVQAGLAPSPLFDPEIYRADHYSGDDAPFLDYLRKGWPKRQVPTKLFSEEGYQKSHADIRAHGIWGLKHFLFHGLYEGRKIGRCPRLTLFAQVEDAASRELNNARMFWVANGAPSTRMRLPTAIERTQQRLNDIVASPTLWETVRRATEIDPVVGDFRDGDAYHAPPFHDRAYSAVIALMNRVPHSRYGTIICVPWLRTGGADLVACQLAQAVQLAAPDERVLLLRMDAPNLERSEWIPNGVDVALISDILSEVPEATGERLVYTLLQTLEPRRVINVNSLRMWRTLERFGSRMRSQMDLYAYLFCWDQTADGLRVGYPSMFYPSTAANLTGLFTDTDYLRLELARLYAPPEDILRRTTTLHTPARTEPPEKTFAELGEQTRAGRRPRVVWAGRLDRQKRFDLVQNIAAKMPDVDFLCWGGAVLDSPPDHSRSPRNLTLRPGFSSYDELPLKESDVFLFTSAWEGMPTILIEAAVRGVSVVASAVGGVPELIDDDTGYPVRDVDDVDAYVSALRDAIVRPDERVRRARNLQKRAASRFSLQQYVKDLRDVFEKGR